MTSVKLLLINASAQIFVSSILGFLLLIPMQPWGKNFLKGVRNPHDLRSTHLDWLMLAFMQYGAAFVLTQIPVRHANVIACLLVFGGWVNAFPYLVRGIWGINAFSLSGGGKQILAASIGLLSVFSILTAWLLVLMEILIL